MGHLLLVHHDLFSRSSEADPEPERSFHRPVPDPRRQDGAHRERRRGHKDGGESIPSVAAHMNIETVSENVSF